jgi:hypothetical protein
LLEQQGNSATALGSSTINGESVQGYSVTLNAAALKAQFNKEHLPAFMQSVVSKLSNAQATYKVYITGSGMLARLTSDIAASLSGQNVVGTFSEDLSDYGLPVTITAPPASEVITFQQLLSKAMTIRGSSAS